MEDKTAEIPSLKEFSKKDKQPAGRKKPAHARPTQSGGRHSRSSSNRRVSDSTRQFSPEETAYMAKGKKNFYVRDTRVSLDRNTDMDGTRVFDTPLVKKNPRSADRSGEIDRTPRKKSYDSRADGSDIRKRKTATPPRTKGGTSRGAHSQDDAPRRRPAPAPSTYARDRIKEDHNVRHYREDSHSNARPADKSAVRTRRADIGGDVNDERSSRRTSEPRPVSQSRTRKPHKPEKAPKPRKPLSPTARKLRNFLVYVAIMAVVILVGAVLSLTVLFKTESINVSGNGPYPVQEIIEVSGLSKGENIFTAPKSWAQSKLEKRYPYIEEANVYAVFPNAINIDITMAKPACVVEDSGSYYVVSSRSKVMEVVATADEIDAPLIEGTSIKGVPAGGYIEYESDIVGTALEEIFTAFAEYGCTKITAINVASGKDGTLEFKYVYDDRIVVYLGIPEHLNYKIQTAHTIITDKIDVGNTSLAGELDVSMCYESKKSYFNQYTILAPNQAPTTSPSSPTDATAPADGEYEYYDEYAQQDAVEGDYYDGSEDYYDDGSGDYYDDGSGEYYAE